KSGLRYRVMSHRPSGKLGALPLPGWGEGWGEGDTGLTVGREPPHPFLYVAKESCPLPPELGLARVRHFEVGRRINPTLAGERARAAGWTIKKNGWGGAQPRRALAGRGPRPPPGYPAGPPRPPPPPAPRLCPRGAGGAPPPPRRRRPPRPPLHSHRSQAGGAG